MLYDLSYVSSSPSLHPISFTQHHNLRKEKNIPNKSVVESAIFPKTFPISILSNPAKRGSGKSKNRSLEQESIPSSQNSSTTPPSITFVHPPKGYSPLLAPRNFNKFHEFPSKSQRGKLEHPPLRWKFVPPIRRKTNDTSPGLIYRGDNLRVTSPPR